MSGDPLALILPLMANRLRASWLVPAGLLVLAFVPTAAGVVRLVALARGDATLQGHHRFAADPVPGVLHIASATSFLVAGALQFSKGVRHRHPRWHRAMGWALAPLGLVAALSGMWMALRWTGAPYAGPALTAMRLVVGSAMSGFIVVSLLALRRRDYLAHGGWMTRAYALGAGAGTQFFVFIPWLLLPSIRTVTLHAALHALGWIINVLVAEAALRRHARRRSHFPFHERDTLPAIEVEMPASR